LTLCAAYVGDVDDAGQAGVADDRQVPEMAARHDLGRVTDACRGADDGRASGHQVMDPGTVHVLSIGDRVGNVRFGDDACRLAGPGVQDHQSGRARVLHQVGGRSDVVALFYRRQRWPHYVCGCGRGGGVGLLGHLFYLYLSTFTFRWGPELGAGRGAGMFAVSGFPSPRYSPTSQAIWSRLARSWPWTAVPVRLAAMSRSRAPGSRAMHISTRAWLVRRLQFAMIKQSTIYSSNILLVSNCKYRLGAASGVDRRNCRPERAMFSA
jgi:hypothetical protein